MSWNLTETDLKKTFESCGSIEEAKIITDRDSGRSKGFGFVTFTEEAAVQEALKLNGTTLDNRAIKVDVAVDRPRTERQGNFGGGNRGGFDNNDRGFKRNFDRN